MKFWKSKIVFGLFITFVEDLQNPKILYVLFNYQELIFYQNLELSFRLKQRHINSPFSYVHRNEKGNMYSFLYMFYKNQYFFSYWHQKFKWLFWFEPFYKVRIQYFNPFLKNCIKNKQIWIVRNCLFTYTISTYLLKLPEWLESVLNSSWTICS